MSAPANFDRLARLYRTLELAMFGRTLERARRAHLPHLAHSADVLLLGDGDGRIAQRILEGGSCRRLVSVDASRAMLSLAEQRITAPADRDRITFLLQDARTFDVAPRSIDAVVTQFFLDCFTAAETAALVRRLAAAVRPGGLWLYTDFDVPERGPGRWLAHGVIKILYWFFRSQTGITAAALPPAESDIRRNGFAAVAERAFALGMVRSVVYRKQSVEPSQNTRIREQESEPAGPEASPTFVRQGPQPRISAPHTAAMRTASSPITCTGFSRCASPRGTSSACMERTNASRFAITTPEYGSIVSCSSTQR